MQYRCCFPAKEQDACLKATAFRSYTEFPRIALPFRHWLSGLQGVERARAWTHRKRAPTPRAYGGRTSNSRLIGSNETGPTVFCPGRRRQVRGRGATSYVESCFVDTQDYSQCASSR